MSSCKLQCNEPWPILYSRVPPAIFHCSIHKSCSLSRILWRYHSVLLVDMAKKMKLWLCPLHILEQIHFPKNCGQRHPLHHKLKVVHASVICRRFQVCLQIWFQQARLVLFHCNPICDSKTKENPTFEFHSR